MIGKGLDILIEFLKEFFLLAAIPASSRESKKVIKDLILGYKKIHRCPNDCMFYWDNKDKQQSCHACDNSRWLSTNANQLSNDSEITHKKPMKVLRYFPLISRL